jgi:hypothetical protein
VSRHLVTIEGDPNSASRYLNYRSVTLSSRTSSGLLGRVMGPTTYGEVATVVSVERVVDMAAEYVGPVPVGTRLGFRFGMVPGLSHEIGEKPFDVYDAIRGHAPQSDDVAARHEDRAGREA